MFFTWSGWLSKAKNQTRKLRRGATGRERFIPHIESLETRVAPAIDYVTNLSGNASAPGSLGYEVANATPGDTILFQTTGTIYLPSGNISITKNLTIDGTGANITVSGAKLSGITQGGVFNVNGATTDKISGLTITGGSATNGGGIFNSSGGNTTLSNDTLSGNSATNGGGIFNSAGNVTLTNDTLSGNSATQAGGGILNNTTGLGGTGNVTLTNDTLSGNSATSGGGIYNRVTSTLTLTNDTLSGNSAHFGGGGIYNSGGDVTLTNDTLSGNSADSGGGIYNGHTLTLTNDTLSGNSALSGGGIYNVTGHSSDLYDTIIAGNTAAIGFTGPDVSGAVTGMGYNLVGNISGSTGFSTANHDILSPGNLYFGALQNNGGPTPTIALLPGCRALNAGNPASPAATTDQRGFPRVPVNIGGNNFIDIGAYENQSQLFTLVPPASEPSVVAGNPGSFNLGSFAYPTAANVWQVDVNWGDGTPDTVFTAFIRGSLGTQSHTYATSGSHAITITLTDADGNFGQMSSPNVTVLPGLVVTNTNDSGPGSLRQAISNANLYYTNGTITFTSSVTGTIKVTSSALPQIARGLNIQGPGANVLAVSGGNLYQVFNIGSHGNVQISGLTISHGSAGKLISGGGVYVKTGGNLSLSNDVITNNSAVLGAGIYTTGITTLTNVIIQNNVATSTGFYTSGGGIYVNSGGNLTITNGVIANNSADYGGGIRTRNITTLIDVAIRNNVATTAGGGISEATFGNLTLTDDTLSGNQVLNGSGGAIASASGANTLTLTDDTIANNSAKVAGGGLSLDYTVHLNNDTIAGNSAASGGGIYLGSNATSTIFDTIVDGNRATTGKDIDSKTTSATSSGGNLYGNTSGNPISWLPSLDHQDLNDNPGLVPLGNNGGPTQTMAELPTSPALGSGYILSAPTLGAFGTATTGGTLAGNTIYYYVITALNSQGQTLPSTEGFITTGSGTSTNTVTVNWTAVPGATGYKIYGRAKGAELLLATVGNVTTYIDTGSITPSGPLPTSNTTVPPTDQRGFQRVVGGKIDIGAFENQSQLFTLTNPGNATVPAGQSTAISLGSFSYIGSAPNVFKVDVNWGDSSADTVFTVVSTGSLDTQDHTYTTGGTFDLTITVSAANGDFSSSPTPLATVTTTVWQGTSLGGYVTQIASALDKNGHLELFGIGGDHALWYNVQTSGSSFTGWSPLGGYVKQITVTAQAGGLLDVFAVGGDNAAYLITQNVGGSWTPGSYTDLGGYVQQLAAGLDLNGHLELFGIGGDNGLWYDMQTSGTTFGGWSPLGGYVKQITVGTNFDGTLQVFGIGGDNGAWSRKQHSTGNLTFDSWTPLGGYVTQLATGLDLNHHLELFGIGGDHAIWVNSQTDNTGVNFSGWTSLGGYVTQISVTTDQGDLDVFGIGGDSAIWYRKQNTANNLAFDPYARVAASIAQLSAVTDNNGNAAVFAIGKAFSDGQFFDQV